MSGGRPGSRADHDRFCRREGWTVVRNARGGAVGHHVTYEFALPDGRILRTRISRPPDATTYGPGLWRRILTDQLDVTEDEFWACVDEKTPPDRSPGPADPPASALPAGLVHQLIHGVGRPETEVATLTLEEAVQVLTEYWSRPQHP